jgi:hypothetical protein
LSSLTASKNLQEIVHPRNDGTTAIYDKEVTNDNNSIDASEIV